MSSTPDPGSSVQGYRPMTDRTFSRFKTFIKDELGINITDGKRTMLQARLQKRLRNLGLSSFEDYCDYVFSDAGRKTELLSMIDVVTTNKTDFFREPKHFEYLSRIVLPEMVRSKKAGFGRPATFWSAGCSTGEEPYTLAMVLSDFAALWPGFKFSILATDISGQVLKKAALGIYDHEKIEPVPMAMRKKYMLRGKDRSRNIVRMTPAIRAEVTFRRMNLMESDNRLRALFDVIFFRNVIIYFDRPTQERVLLSVCRRLRSDGVLFLGHSETLNGLNLPLKPLVSTVYQKID